MALVMDIARIKPLRSAPYKQQVPGTLIVITGMQLINVAPHPKSRGREDLPHNIIYRNNLRGTGNVT
jgi:hypothetical protein